MSLLLMRGAWKQMIHHLFTL